MDALFKDAKRHLGQNFLIDSIVKDRIFGAADPRPGETILEIGPGLGDLTERLVKTGAVVYAIEKDAALIPHLQKRIGVSNVHLIREDFLTFDFSQLPEIDKIIGNIPYNISTPIIERIISQRSRCRNVFLTVQLEFARRLSAQPNTKDYGALTCFVQYYYDIVSHFIIHPQSFRPVPKVTSSFIQLSLADPGHQAEDERVLFQVTRTAFSNRRKTILNALSPLLKKDLLKHILRDLKIEESLRPENIALEQYVELADAVSRELSLSTRKTSV